MTRAGDDREGFAAFLLRARAKGVDDKRLIAAIEAVPRRGFVSGQWQSVVWCDRMIPIECGETLEGIDLQAQIVHTLGLEPKHRVLEIGTGSGYTAALMAQLAGRVVTVDHYKTLVDQARHRLDALGIANVVVRQADAANGLAGEGAFDRIVCWAAFSALPRNFVDQLSTNGLMIAPIGPGEGEQALVHLQKVGSRFDRSDIGVVRFQPLLEGVAAAI